MNDNPSFLMSPATKKRLVKYYQIQLARAKAERPPSRRSPKQWHVAQHNLLQGVPKMIAANCERVIRSKSATARAGRLALRIQFLATQLEEELRTRLDLPE